MYAYAYLVDIKKVEKTTGFIKISFHDNRIEQVINFISYLV